MAHTVLMAGSGSVGHMSPVVSVADELLSQGHDVLLVTDRGSQFAGVFQGVEGASSELIMCGKYRRYPGMKISPHYRLKIIFENLLDLVRTALGVLQALLLLLRKKPDAIFLKGGAISVPIGIAAKILRVPFVTHDSDTIPGLSNRTVGRWAVYNLVNGPPENYDYPESKSMQVGIPLRDQFRRLAKSSHKHKYDYDVLFVGGSQGSTAINGAAIALAEANSDIAVANLCGRGNSSDSGLQNLAQFEYVEDPANIIASSKLVVARSSATFVAELAALSKSCIFSPHPGLSDQKSNAKLIESKRAGRVVLQSDNFIADVIAECLSMLDLNEAGFSQYGKLLNDVFGSEDAVDTVVDIIKELAASKG